MLKKCFAVAVLMTCFGAHAMPQFEEKYLCTAPNGNSVVVGFEVHDNKLVLSGLGGDIQNSGLPCDNMPLQTKTMGAMTVSLTSTCDDKSISLATAIDFGAGTKMDLQLAVTKTGEGTAGIHVKAKGNMNGQDLDTDITLTCVK